MIAVDIETIPNLDIVDLLPDVKADTRLKDEEKIKADIEQKTQEQISKMALSPMYGKIACISLYGAGLNECLMINKDGTGEKELLEKFFELTHKRMVYTWNGKGFDYDFIFKRAIYHNLKTLRDMKFYIDKYKSTWHIDLMAEFCQFGKYEKLDEVAKIFLGKRKVDCDVTTIKYLIKTDDGRKKLKEYCDQDTKLVYDLALKFGYNDNLGD